MAVLLSPVFFSTLFRSARIQLEPEAIPEWVDTAANVIWSVLVELAEIIADLFGWGVESTTLAGFILLLIIISFFLNH